MLSRRRQTTDQPNGEPYEMYAEWKKHTDRVSENERRRVQWNEWGEKKAGISNKVRETSLTFDVLWVGATL